MKICFLGDICNTVNNKKHIEKGNIFPFSGIMPRSAIAGSYGKSIRGTADCFPEWPAKALRAQRLLVPDNLLSLFFIVAIPVGVE